MKTLLFLLLIPFILLAQVNSHSTKVHSYTKKSGTRVQGYKRTQSNHLTKDNYSHKGNTNPNTGKKGYRK